MVKRVVKVYLSKRQMELLERICQSLGVDYSGFFEMLLLEYVKDINLAKRCIQGGEEVPDRA